MTGEARDRVRALIVDDESLSRDVVREYLQRHPEVEIIGESANGFDAVKRIMDDTPDLLFLDIQMPKLNGFEVLELVGKPPAVIFITAFDEYALQAFEVHAADYLLKPFSQERFDEALAQAMKHLSSRSLPPADVIASEVLGRVRPLERILVREGCRVHVLPTTSVDYVEAQDDYIRIVAEGKAHLKQQRLSELEADLDNGQFIRIHRSYIINIERIARIELYAKESRIAILKDGTRLPVSRSGYERIKAVL
jgi:two-component system, LytTR family, response regulator